MLKAATGAVIRVLVYVAKAHSYLWRKPPTKNGRALPALMRKVEAIRLRDGVTQKALAKKMGVTPVVTSVVGRTHFASASTPGRTLGLDPLVGDTRIPFLRVTNKRRSTVETKEIDAVVEQLRDFLRGNYMTGAEVARRIGVKDMTVYSWLQGESRPSKPERITAFLNSIPAEPGSGVAPNGYQYRGTKIGAVSLSQDVVRSVSKQRARFER
jgi:transcriptional regulator with XRE-family HTH domain